MILKSLDHGRQFWKKIISPDFIWNFRKSHQVSKSSLESSESCGEKTEGVP